MDNETKARLVDTAMEQIASLEDPYDPSDTAAVEVQLDTIATTFSQLRPRKPRKSTSQSQEELRDVLARLAEGGLVDAMAITIYDEIDNVIRLKDYEGYSDDYVSERLGALLSDLADELRPAIEKLQVEANQ